MSIKVKETMRQHFILLTDSTMFALASVILVGVYL